MVLGVCVGLFLQLSESCNDALLASLIPRDFTTEQGVADFGSDNVAVSIICGPPSYVFLFAWHNPKPKP